MSRMESDPSPYSGVSRFPISFHPRRSHFPAYSAMIQFGCAFYAPAIRRWSVVSVWVVTVRGLANSSERGMKKRLESWIGRGGVGGSGKGAKERNEEGPRSYPALKTDCSAFKRVLFARLDASASPLLSSSPVHPFRAAPFSPTHFPAVRKTKSGVK